MRFIVPRVASKLYHLAFVLGIGFLLCGCGPKVEGKKYDPYEGVQTPDIDKVKEFLKKAEVAGEVARIQDEKDFWRVEVTAPPPEPGKKGGKFAQLAGNRIYRVDKATGKVTDEGPAGG